MDQNDREAWQSEKEKWGQVSHFLMPKRKILTDVNVKIVEDILGEEKGAVVLRGCVATIAGTELAKKYPNTNWYLVSSLKSENDKLSKEIVEGGLSNAFNVLTDCLAPIDIPEKVDAIIGICNWMNATHQDELIARYMSEFLTSLKNGGILVINTIDFDAIKRTEGVRRKTEHTVGDFSVKYQTKTEILPGRMYSKTSLVKFKKEGESVWSQNINKLLYKVHHHMDVKIAMSNAGFSNVEFVERKDAPYVTFVIGEK